MKAARILVRLLGVLLILALIAIVGGFALLQTAPGKSMLASIAGRLASTGGLTVQIEGLSGFVPTDMRVERITLSDPSGAFGSIEGLHLAWSPLSLLSGTVDVRELTSDRIALDRRPALPPSEAAPSSGGSVPMLRVVLDRLAIGQIDIGEAVAGMAAKLALTASARLVTVQEGLSLDFALTRLDAPGEVRGSARYSPDNGRDILALDVTASEPAGGLVARLAQIEGLPALSLTVQGSAPLDDWNGKLALDAGAAGRIEGTGAVRNVEGGRRVMLDLGGSVSGLVPAVAQPLFADHTTLMGSAVVGDAGAVKIEGLNLSAAGFGVALVGALDTEKKTAGLTLDVVGGDAAHFATLAPGVGWTGWRLNASVAGPFATPSVLANLSASGLTGHGYGAKNLMLAAKAAPDGDRMGFTLDGSATGLSADEPKVAAALGTSGTFKAAGSTGATGPEITSATINLAPVDLTFSGSAAARAVKGSLDLARLDLTAFSALAGRPLSGAVRLKGTLDTGDHFERVAFDMDGAARDVATGVAMVDGFLKGETRFKGAVARAADGTIQVSGLDVAATGLDLRVDGGIQKDTADLTAKLALADLGRLDPRVSGGAKADLRFSGGLDKLGVAGRIDVPSATAMGKPIRDLALVVDLSDLTGRPGGTVRLDGRIADRPARGTARLTTLASGRRIDDLDFTIGSVRATGGAGIADTGLVDGRFTVAAANLDDLSALILTEIAGRLDATVVLDAVNGAQRVAVNGRAQDIRFAGNRLASADIDARVVDPAGRPVIDGRATLSGLVAGSQRIDKATLTAKSVGAATNVTLDTVVLGTSLAARANVTPAPDTTRIRLDSLRLAQGSTAITLSSPANFIVSSGNVAVDRLQLATGGGGATISGRAGQTLDLTAELRNLPLTLAALVAPALDLRGTLSGRARITGSPSAPTGDYDLRIAKLQTGDLARQGLGPFEIAARGTLANGQARVDATINAPSVSGLTVRGTVPIGGSAMDLRVAGTLDLAIANTMLANSGATVRGKAVIDGTLRGTAAAPAAAGTVRVSGASYINSDTGITITNIQAVLTGTDRAIQVTSLSAQTPKNGTITGSGNIRVEPLNGFPASIQIQMNRANLVSSDLVQLVTDGRISITGPVATRPKIEGRLDIRRLDVNIADKLPGGGVDPLQVRHINTGGQRPTSEKGLRAQAQARAKAVERRQAAPPAAFVADLDLTLAAANGVFVRGMGIDAEFSGNVTLRGTTANPVTGGGFTLRRGRFDILGRRLDFTSGEVGFNGSTDPTIDFTAQTTSDGVTASVIVSGTASKPSVTFSSTPQLAPDEVLARILFGRSVATLNSSQALQLAQAAAQFSGGGPGVLDTLRRSLGVDSLNVDATGTVGIGKRLNDRVYVGASGGANPSSSKVTVDVDVTRNIQIQGAARQDGNAELGIGAQWDY